MDGNHDNDKSSERRIVDNTIVRLLYLDNIIVRLLYRRILARLDGRR